MVDQIFPNVGVNRVYVEDEAATHRYRVVLTPMQISEGLPLLTGKQISKMVRESGELLNLQPEFIIGREMDGAIHSAPHDNPAVGTTVEFGFRNPKQALDFAEILLKHEPQMAIDRMKADWEYGGVVAALKRTADGIAAAPTAEALAVNGNAIFFQEIDVKRTGVTFKIIGAGANIQNALTEAFPTSGVASSEVGSRDRRGTLYLLQMTHADAKALVDAVSGKKGVYAGIAIDINSLGESVFADRKAEIYEMVAKKGQIYPELEGINVVAREGRATEKNIVLEIYTDGNFARVNDALVDMAVAGLFTIDKNHYRFDVTNPTNIAIGFDTADEVRAFAKLLKENGADVKLSGLEDIQRTIAAINDATPALPERVPVFDPVSREVDAVPVARGELIGERVIDVGGAGISDAVLVPAAVMATVEVGAGKREHPPLPRPDPELLAVANLMSKPLRAEPLQLTEGAPAAVVVPENVVTGKSFDSLSFDPNTVDLKNTAGMTKEGATEAALALVDALRENAGFRIRSFRVSRVKDSDGTWHVRLKFKGVNGAEQAEAMKALVEEGLVNPKEKQFDNIAAIPLSEIKVNDATTKLTMFQDTRIFVTGEGERRRSVYVSKERGQMTQEAAEMMAEQMRAGIDAAGLSEVAVETVASKEPGKYFTKITFEGENGFEQAEVLRKTFDPNAVPPTLQKGQANVLASTDNVSPPMVAGDGLDDNGDPMKSPEVEVASFVLPSQRKQMAKAESQIGGLLGMLQSVIRNAAESLFGVISRPAVAKNPNPSPRR